MLQAKRIPLLVRRGGRDIKKMARSLLIRSGRGGRSQVMFGVSEHPVCGGAKVGFADIFLMPQPPLSRNWMLAMDLHKRITHLLCEGL